MFIKALQHPLYGGANKIRATLAKMSSSNSIAKNNLLKWLPSFTRDTKCSQKRKAFREAFRCKGKECTIATVFAAIPFPRGSGFFFLFLFFSQQKQVAAFYCTNTNSVHVFGTYRMGKGNHRLLEDVSRESFPHVKGVFVGIAKVVLQDSPVDAVP